jgi:hypothetical protein
MKNRWSKEPGPNSCPKARISKAPSDSTMLYYMWSVWNIEAA